MKSSFIVYSRNINKKKLQIDEVYLRDEWEKQGMDEICPSIIEWNVTNLCLRNCNRPQIARKISQIEFPRLSYLEISHNHIESIEAIPIMKVSSLKSLILSFNNVRTLKMFKKVHWPRVSNLQLHENLIVDGKELVLLSGKNLVSLSLDSKKQNQADEVSWIGKMETSKLQNFWIQNENKKIESQTITDVIKKRLDKMIVK